MTKALQVVRAKNDLLVFLLCWNNNPNVKPVNQFFSYSAVHHTNVDNLLYY